MCDRNGGMEKKSRGRGSLGFPGECGGGSGTRAGQLLRSEPVALGAWAKGLVRSCWPRLTEGVLPSHVVSSHWPCDTPVYRRSTRIQFLARLPGMGSGEGDLGIGEESGLIGNEGRERT